MESNRLSWVYRFLTLSLIFLLLACSSKMTPQQVPQPEAGVSKALAEYRKKAISGLTYHISLDIPPGKAQPIQASESISFTLKENTLPLQIDFKENTHHLRSITVNGTPVPVKHTQEHILIEPAFLKAGQNRIDIAFVAGNLSLNRNDDYLYTLLVPDRARTVFPCFDQPDLKATYVLSLTVPRQWIALSNAPVRDSVATTDKKTYHFGASDVLSTYLFAFAAGEFATVRQELDGRRMHFYHRETDAGKIAQSMGPIFTIHREALAFMEAYTGIPYPFQKFDFIAIPDFQYGGMEHAGAIDYKASSLFLDKGATTSQQLGRAGLIAHETAHMWFGDLVTMRWFDDVWMKEVFANFMADKITQVALPEVNYDLKFLIDHFPAAYGVDRTEGANPIRQNLENLQDAGTLYGNIIYHKAPIVMRQLERLMGQETLRDGLREYLKTYANGNASWPDLIAMLDARTALDLQSWNKVWVNETGRPQFSYRLETDGTHITGLYLTQKGEDSTNRVWPQLFEVALVYPDHTEEVTVQMNGATVALQAVAGKPKPSCIVFNASGQGYGLFPVDEQVTSYLYALPDPVTRAATYINLYENMLSGRYVTPLQLLELYRKGLAAEQEELNLKLLAGQVSDVYWQYILPDQRLGLSAGLEKDLWQAMEGQAKANAKKVLFQTYQSIALGREALDRLYAIWKREQAPEGVTLTEDDYTALATSLAVKDYPGAEEILNEQLSRIQNPDRKQRLQFLMPALSPDVKRRDAFFASLSNEQNREKEAWVSMALGYLHHPLRAGTSEKYLPHTLDLLEEIQRTGDIFFPQNWLGPSFGQYQSRRVAQLIRRFLAERPGYNPRLKAKILQAADGVFRAEKLVAAPK
jgi:aminopeptidase N